ERQNYVCDATVNSTTEPLDFYVTFQSGIKEPELHLSYHTAADPTERVVSLPQLLVPWAPAEIMDIKDEKTAEPARVTADARRGEVIFSGQVARCSACHAIHGRGPKLGPELSQLINRDVGSILRDIREPSATINPDYVSYLVLLKSGRTLS